MEFENLESARNRLNSIEGRFTETYFQKVLHLLPEKLRPEKRSNFKAYDGVNNIFNLAYEVQAIQVICCLVCSTLTEHRASCGACSHFLC